MIVLALIAQISAATAPYPAELRISDEVLSEQRGGIRLPNGIDLAMTIQSQTAVNGSVVLRTVVSVDKAASVVTVFAPKAGMTVAAPPSRVVPEAAPAATVTYDRVSGLQVTTPSAAPISVSAGTGALAGNASDVDGLEQVDAINPVTTDNGVITTLIRDRQATIDLKTADLNISHFTGNAFGTAISNSGNDRAIDTQTVVSINLQNAGPDVLGSAMLRVERLSLDALASRM